MAIDFCLLQSMESPSRYVRPVMRISIGMAMIVGVWREAIAMLMVPVLWVDPMIRSTLIQWASLLRGFCPAPRICT